MGGDSCVLRASLCPAVPPLGICGCHVLEVVAGWLFRLHPPLGETQRSPEQAGDEVRVKSMGCWFRSALPKLWFSTALYGLWSTW